MSNLLKQISLLYEQELYSNTVKLCESVITICDQKPDFTPFMKYQLYVHYADSLYNLQQYVEASNIYLQVFEIRKYLLKTKSAMKASDSQKELPSDVEFKYRCHTCFIKQKQITKAIDILQSIQVRNRTACINMALGNLYKETGMERSAVTCYKEVLRENPYAFEAAENLLKLGVKGAEVNSLMLEATKELTWLNTWLRAHAQMYMKDYSSAINTFKSLDTLGYLKNNSQLYLNIAYCYNYICNSKSAKYYLQRALQITPTMKTGRDLLAALLYAANDKESITELEKLATLEVDPIHWTAEDWIVVGYLMMLHKRHDRAAYFGQQACNLNKKSVEGCLLKAEAFMQLGKYNEALQPCREILQHSSNRYEAHRCLVEAYIAMNKLREAVAMAAAACKQLSNSPQALTLYASVLMRDPMTSCKVRSYLERALNIDPTYSTAVYLLAEHLEENHPDNAYALLKKHAETSPSSTAHQILADYLLRHQRDEEAYEHYNAALRLDPEHQRALEGLNNIGRSLSANKLDSSCYVSAIGDTPTFNSQAQSQSDHDQDQESDTDPWPANSEFMPYE